MSRVGRQPIPIPEEVEVKIEGSLVTAKGPKGELSLTVDADMQLELSDGELSVKRPTDQTRHRALHGLTRTLVANVVEGVTNGFERTLEIHGVGYRAIAQGKNLELHVGFSHTVKVEAPEGIELALEGPAVVHVRGIDKQLVGETAARIRAIRPPEPYKGKGIRYRGEHVRRKAGKATVGGLG